MNSGSKLLQDFFGGLITETFASTIGLRDAGLTHYISEMLANFCQSEELYKIRNAAGRPHDRASQDFTLDLALRVLAGAPAPRTTVQSPLTWSDSPDWKLETRNCPVCGSGPSRAKTFLKQSLDVTRLNEFSYASRKTPEFMRFELVTCGSCRTVVRCVTSPANESSVEFHRALGFEVERVVRDYDGPGEDRVLLRKQLS